ncbi:nucleotidyltransferase domain-containing protein [Candidatus Woesearchaeota archaeon]|nr:nucleotidyltransferase domain-containing protein [Candidatus Woesearchaeota archaeon]
MAKKQKKDVKEEPEKKSQDAVSEGQAEKKEDLWERELERMGVKLPKEAQKKFREIKEKLDSFKDRVMEKFGDYIVGVALLPPSQPMQGQFAGQPMPPGMPPMQPQPIQPMHGMPQVQPIRVPYQAPGMSQMQQMPAQGMPAVQAMPQVSHPSLVPQVPAEQINVLILVDDSDSRKMPKEELKSKLITIIQTIAAEVDQRLAPQIFILSEVWQSCFDAKYDLTALIATAAPVFDKGMLAAIRIAEVHKTRVLAKFERYIVSYVLAGSLIQGKATEKSDVDVFIVIDDTDVKRMTRAELKDKLRAIIIGMAIEAGELTGVKNKLNVQVYILTDFWDSIREANPIIFTFLRDGVPFYDRGIFMPWKQLLQMGRIKPSQEAIDMYMSTGDQILKRVNFKLKEIGMEDTFWAILTPSQAALMLYGVPPPTPKETPEIMREIFVKKLGLLEDEFVKILERNIQVRKELEHGDKADIFGKEIDELVKDADRYLKRLNTLFEEIQKIREADSMLHIYDNALSMVRDVLRLEGVEKVEEGQAAALFEQRLVKDGKVPAKFLRTFGAISAAKKDYDSGKLTKAEVEKVKKDAEGFTRFMIEYVQRKRGRELERARIRVKHGNRYGEVLLLDKEAFIIHDIDHRDKEISRALITESGGLASIRASSGEELEKSLARSQIPERVFLKEPVFEDLKRIFGKDVEVQVSFV